MPAPSSQVIRAALVKRLLDAGLGKKSLSKTTSKLVDAIPPQLPEFKQKEIDAIALAIHDVWDVWQKTQFIVGVDSGTSALVVGVPPTALP